MGDGLPGAVREVLCKRIRHLTAAGEQIDLRRMKLSAHSAGLPGNDSLFILCPDSAHRAGITGARSGQVVLYDLRDYVEPKHFLDNSVYL
jgi:hypothetical protein